MVNSMKKEVNRALVAKKKKYQTPVSEEMQVVSVGIMQSVSSTPPTPAPPAPRPRGGKLW